MNPEPVAHAPGATSPPPVGPSPEPPQTIVSLPNHGRDFPAPAHRGNGKVAQFPKALRDQINFMLRDGVRYPEIIRRLGEPGKGLKPGHLHEYYRRGFQEWLQQQEWLERVTAKSEFSADLLAAPDTANLHEAGLRLAAAYMLDQLGRFAAAGADPQPEMFARLVNALSRLSREALAAQKYHDAQLLLTEADPSRPINEDARDLFRKRVEEFFHLKPLNPPPPATQTDFLESP